MCAHNARKKGQNEMPMRIKLKLRLLIWLAKQLFNYIVVYETDGRSCLFLAHSERDLNCAVRGFVEALDQYYIDKQNRKDNSDESS
jgi:hypothetical protein